MSIIHELITIMKTHSDEFSGLKRVGWFKNWLRKNIHIYNEFERCAIHLYTNGKRKRYSARAILHHLRWNTLFEENPIGDYKISNDCTPYIARLVMIRNPQLRGMFLAKSSKEE